MKKINLLFSTLMICLAVLLASCTMMPALQFQATAVKLNPTSNADQKLTGKYLFDSQGRYAVQQSDLQQGETFQFFGYDWRVVYVNEDQKVATFWMADPYTKTIFDKTTAAANGINVNGSNIWSNGYKNMVWKKNSDNNNTEVYLGESEISQFLTNEANTMIDNAAYASYKDKVVAGYVSGTNEDNTEASAKTISKLAYSKSSTDNVTGYKEGTNELEANYSLGQNVRLWLPSVKEIDTIWNLPEPMLGWTNNTISDRAWLRTPDVKNSEYALSVCSEKQGTDLDSYFASKAIGQEAGVRPAIHLDITNIQEEYEDHIKNSGNGANDNDQGWFKDEWMEIFFIVVCVLGIIGVTLVIIAVVVKSRKNEAN